MMKNTSLKNILTDTGFWIAYFEERDEYHKVAQELSSVIFDYNIIIPFPSVYEFLNTRFSRRSKQVNELEFPFRKLNIVYVYDDAYRTGLIQKFIRINKGNRTISAVDMVINQILEDVNIKIDCIVTFNEKDFFHSCKKRNIEILAR